MKTLKFFIVIILLNSSLMCFSQTEKWLSIQIPVSDGNTLNADLYVFNNDTITQKPVIFIQTPYDKNLYHIAKLIPINAGKQSPFFDTLSYNYVIMDWRGFYSNKSIPNNNDRGKDGFDAIEWIATQKWCNGKVGTWGSSALGLVQFETAAKHPPHLVCSAPFVKDFQTKYEDYYYGGDLRREQVESLQSLGFITVKVITKYPDYSFYWQAIEATTDLASKIEVPMLLVSGWFDHYPSDVIRAFQDLKVKSSSNQHKLIMGPWTHSTLGLKSQGELEFIEAENIPQIVTKDFFGFYLLNEYTGWNSRPDIQYFRMGDNKWFNEEDWNNIKINYDTLYLNFQHQLTKQSPIPTMPPIPPTPDTIFYNPKDPSPTVGGSRFNPGSQNVTIGPYDISNNVEARNDILIYTTQPFENNYNVTGKINIELFVGSNCKDTDFGVRLCDVYPDGRSIILTQGIKRARFRNSLTNETLIDSSIFKIDIILSDISNCFLKGHSLRIDISSSNYPMFDINPNSGTTMYVESDTINAINLVWHNDNFSSRVILPVQNTSDNILENISINKNITKVSSNPFNSKTQITYHLNVPSNVELNIFSQEGILIKNFSASLNSNGDYFYEFNGEGEPSGIYYYIFKNGTDIETGKIILIR